MPDVESYSAHERREKKEKPESQKYDHAYVHYSAKSDDADECRGCEHFIAPNRCTGVKSPIAPGGWCVRFDPK